MCVTFSQCGVNLLLKATPEPNSGWQIKGKTWTLDSCCGCCTSGRVWAPYSIRRGKKIISKFLFYKSDPLNNTFLNCCQWFLPYWTYINHTLDFAVITSRPKWITKGDLGLACLTTLSISNNKTPDEVISFGRVLSYPLELKELIKSMLKSFLLRNPTLVFPLSPICKYSTTKPD